MNVRSMFIDRDSFAWMYIRQKASSLAQHPGFNPSERQDLESEFWLSLVQKANRYDSSRGQESTFIAQVVNAKYSSLIRRRTAAKRHFRHNGQSLHESIRDADGSLLELLATLSAETVKNHLGQHPRTDVDMTDLRIDMEHILDSLNDNGIHQVAKLLMVMSRHAASREPGQSRRNIARNVEQLRQRIEDSSLREYL